MAATSGKSGVFVVDLSALNLSATALKKVERAINSTVQKEVGKIDLRAGGGIRIKRPQWMGIWIEPTLPQFR
jgi:hypothetical protein